MKKRNYSSNKKFNKLKNDKNIKYYKNNYNFDTSINKTKENNEIYEIPNKLIFSPTTGTSSKENKKDFINNILDKIFNNEDLIIIALIIILIYERFKYKNENIEDNNDKSMFSDYDLMIAALIYIYF